ncbi:WD40-repeat-containing domain protein [Collybia nuda]|uniref:WD40-repeat-containing domain protein n=1 Tax=Collybia nuda TaxID=64659 RepID=A0A9P5XV84_9AGAR|nr:WD40-repeat-containing domain protein [Collybia nuda]
MKTFTISDIKYIEDGGGSFLRLGTQKQVEIKITVDGVVKGTVIWSRDSKTDPPPLNLDAPASAIIKFQLYRKDMLNHDVYLGSAEKTIEELCTQALPITAKLYKSTRTGDLQERPRSISFNIHVMTPHEPSNASLPNKPVPEPKDDMGVIDSNLSSADTALADAKAAYSALEMAPWGSALKNVEKFNNLVQGIAELHPYAKVAWGVLSGTHKLMTDQMNRDENIKQLVGILDEIFAFLTESSELKRILATGSVKITDSQIKILTALTWQTTECAHFICAYAKTISYWTRTLKNIVSEADDKIQGFYQQFSKMKSDLQAHAILQTEVTVFQIKFSMEENFSLLNTKLDSTDMLYAPGSGYKPEKQCLPGTRLGIIDEINTWIHDPGNSQQVFWLKGLAGTGKSSIAHSVGRQLDEQKRLGSFFCFDASKKPPNSPQHLFPTVSLDLAGFDKHWDSALANIIKNNKSLRTTDSVYRQFHEFILEPANSLNVVGPIVIVIDALDECGDASSRKVLLEVLVAGVASLPENFRFIITSRPQKDIIEAFQEQPHIYCKDMDTIDGDTTQNDISTYIQIQLSHLVPELDKVWPDKTWCSQLVRRAEELFQWASTACLFINDPLENPVSQLRLLFRNVTNQGLKDLYQQVLTKAVPGEQKQIQLKKILGTLLYAQESLTVPMVADLCLEIDPTVVKKLLQQLGSLFRGVSSSTMVVEPLHTSVRDFLMVEGQGHQFYIDKNSAHALLLNASWAIMGALKFNISQWPSSYLVHTDGYESNPGISAQLLYACKFWAHHLRNVPFNEETFTQVTRFINSKILYWVELLSGTKTLACAIPSLQIVTAWIKQSQALGLKVLKETQQFISTFWEAISQSPAHIYISALPFIPRESILGELYKDHFSNVLRLKTGRMNKWPGLVNVLEGHRGSINSVALSLDGMYIASGSSDGTIRVWDATTGTPVGNSLEGHKQPVLSLAFSPDGTCIISGSLDRTIRRWDVQTSQEFGIPIEGHTAWILSVAFSPDGTWIFSGSSDRTIRVWDAATGIPVGKPFEGHKGPVQCVACSPDGTCIASGSYDNTIRLWDITTGNSIGNPFEGHHDLIESVAFSPDGVHIVSGSHDRTIIVWDAKTGDLINTLVQVNTGLIHSVAFSSDGAYIVSGSSDGTIIVWDATTHSPIGGPFEGHTGPVLSVAFSSDGAHIISGSDDRTIRIWNAADSIPIYNLTEGHTDLVETVAISSDGTHIVSGSADKTIRVWDAATGSPVGHPLEGHTELIESVALSPDGTCIVSGSDDWTVRLWNTITGVPIGSPLQGHTKWVQSVSFSPDGTHIASGSGDETIRIWDVASGNTIGAPWKGHAGPIQCVSFSPDGTFIVSGSADQTVRVWNVATGSSISGPFQGHTGSVQSVMFSPQGRYIVSGSQDATIRIWDAESGSLIGSPFQGHTGSVESVAFSPDGNYVVSGSHDRTIRVWDVNTGIQVGKPFEGHRGYVQSVIFSTDGAHIISGSYDKTIRVWDASFEIPLQKTAAISSDVDLPTNSFSAAAFSDGISLKKENWACGSNQEPLFWVPLQNQNFTSPRNPLIIGSNPTIIDYSHFVHGISWEKCKSSIFI